MLPNQVLPAIPRQKVLKDGYVYNVLSTNPDNTMILQLADMSQKDKAMQTWSYAKPEDCEPVPEEPRPFRCGDAVFVRGTVIPGEDADNYGIYSRISGISKDGKCKIVDRLDWVGKDCIRHATPEELAKYF